MQRMRKCALIAWLLRMSCFAAAVAQGPPAWVSQLTPEQQALFAEAGHAFDTKKYAEALAKFKVLHEQVPGNAVFAKFGAEAAVNTGEFATAKSLLEPVLAATPLDPQALGIQAHLYGQQHDIANRDRALENLQKLHDGGQIKMRSCIVEKDPTPDGGQVNIAYYLEPGQRFNILLMATFFDAAGNETHQTALESDDFDQTSFAKEHPKEAAAGDRVYSIDSYSQQRGPDGKIATQTHATLCWAPGCFIKGQRPTYEFFRSHILDSSGKQDKPISDSPTNAPATPR